MNAHKDVKSIFIFNYIVLFSGIVFSLYYAHFLFVDLKEQSVHKNLIAINTLSSKNVNAHLQNVADSVEALGESYKKLFLQQQTLTQKHPMYHHNFLQNEKITFYSDFLNQEEYPFQSDHVSMVLSNLHQDKETIANELNLFHRLAPALESIYNSFHFSWVYFTTVNDFLAIYPYVPFINAIDVYQPTQQHFYKAADFANKRVGWEEPYSDLAGGGILVTASYPVYDDNEKLLGVASHDITLDKIAESILNTTIIYEGTVSFLLSKEGKVISSNDERYRGELKEQDSHTYRGSFYYRTQKDAGKNGLENIKVSKYAYLNELGDEIISSADMFKNIHTQIWKSSIPYFENKLLVVSHIPANGWLLVSYVPNESIFGEALSLFYQTLLVLAIFITVLFAISAYLTMRHLVIPLDIIIEASRRFGDGFTKVEVYYSRRNLLKNLFATFNDMVKKVNFNNRLLEKKVDERTYALQEEINRRKKVERELRMLSRTDSLTGIWNRGYFFELLKRELERCQRYNINMTLIMIDIDLFKNINDTYGHSVGDQAIKHLVALISANTRKENIFARLGGEEFGIILIEAGGADKIQHVVERIRKNVQDNPLIINTQSIPLTISIGMTNISLEDNEHTIYIRADNALYLAKKNGRNRVEEI